MNSSHAIKVPFEYRMLAKQRGGKWQSHTKSWVMPSLEAKEQVAAALADLPEVEEKKQFAGINIGSVTPIVEKFRIARDKGLKYPALLFFNVATFQKLKITCAAEDSKNPNFLYLKGDNGLYCGKVTPMGRFFPIYQLDQTIKDQLVAFLEEFAEDPVAVAKANGKAAGHCCFCSLPLSDERSLHMGYGPVCAQSWTLPWGERVAPVVTDGKEVHRAGASKNARKHAAKRKVSI